MTKEEKAREQQWQAESDADTMARYNEIMADKARQQRAVAAAKKKAQELMTRATAMTRAAGTKAKK